MLVGFGFTDITVDFIVELWDCGTGTRFVVFDTIQFDVIKQCNDLSFAKTIEPIKNLDSSNKLRAFFAQSKMKDLYSGWGGLKHLDL